MLPWMLGAGEPSGDSLEREFRCEEAVAHAQRCCPGVNAERQYCSSRRNTGCNPRCDPDPVMTLAEATCVRDRSCEELREQGVCAALAELEGTTSCERAESPRAGALCQ